MDLKKALFEANKNKDGFSKMSEVFEQAILTENSLKERIAEIVKLDKSIAESEGKVIKWEKTTATAKATLNETLDTLSKAKTEARAAINAEKNEIIKEKALEIEDLSTKITGKEANLMVLERRENELKGNISRMETTIEDQYKKFMTTKVG